jgi:ubiquitin-protein ligase
MAAPPSPITKQLWNELSRIKLFNQDNNLQKGKFFYENSLFYGDEEDSPTRNIISGKLWPTSNIYKDYALLIEIHLPPTYPVDPPEVKIDNLIYHPNVDDKGE